MKTYFPIYAKYRFEILQLDIADISNLATANKNYKYLLVAIDVYSRLGFVVPMKNKTANTVNSALIEILDQTEPTMINCDNGSEFINTDFKKILTNRGVDDRFVDRFIRTLREKINKYMEMHNMTTYIDVLQSIVKNYNLAYHSGIKKAPIDVMHDDKVVNYTFMKKYMKAKEEEIIFNIGDNVRYMLNFKQFEKHTLPKWSVVHNITDKNVHSYKLDNEKFHKYYELQKVPVVQKLENPPVELTRQHMAREKTVQRKLTKEGISMENIIDHTRLRTKNKII